jgi:PAS domain S-box-containing protein
MSFYQKKSLNFEEHVPGFLRNSSLYYLIITDLEGYYRYVNDRFLEKFGVLSENLEEESSLIGIHPGDHEACLQTVRKCFEMPHQSHQVLLRKLVSATGDFFWSQWEFSMIKHQGGNIGIRCIGHDITDSELASMKAKELVKRLDIILDEISDGFIQLNAGHEIVRVNHNFLSIFNLLEAEIIGKNAEEVLPALLGEISFEELISCYKSNSRTVFDTFLKSKDCWLNFTVYPSAMGLTVFVRDITEEIERKSQIELSETKLRAVFDSTSDSNLLIGLNGEVLNFNRVADEIAKKTKGVGLSRGVHIEDFLPEDSLAGFRENFPKVIAGEPVVVEVQRTIDSRPHWFEVSYFQVHDRANSLIGISMNIRDIDSKKRVELELTENRKILNAIYNSSSEAWTFIDTDFKIRFANKAAKTIAMQLFGKSYGFGDSYFDFVLPEFQEEFKKLAQQALSGEKVIVNKNAGKSYWEVILEPVRLHDNSDIIGISSIVKDITTLKLREERILSQNELLKEITWHQSHGLRRHVANILALCDLLNNYKSDFEKEREQFIEFIFEECRSMDEVIHKIVALSSKGDLDFLSFN